MGETVHKNHRKNPYTNGMQWTAGKNTAKNSATVFTQTKPKTLKSVYMMWRRSRRLETTSPCLVLVLFGKPCILALSYISTAQEQATDNGLQTLVYLPNSERSSEMLFVFTQPGQLFSMMEQNLYGLGSFCGHWCVVCCTSTAALKVPDDSKWLEDDGIKLEMGSYELLSGWNPPLELV